MIEIYRIYLALLILSGVISLSLSFYIWRKYWLEKRVHPARTFAFSMAIVATWAFAAAMALISPNASQTYFWEQVKYIGIFLIPPSWLIFSLQWTGRDKWITKEKIYIIYAISLLFLALVFTDSIHHLIWSNIEYVQIGPYLDTSVIHGIGWWLALSYSYLLILGGTFYLARGFVNLRNVYRKQAIILLLGSFAPWAANVIYALNVSIFPNIDFSSPAFIITGLTFTWGFSQFRLIDIVPVAKDAIFENMNDPVFVLDTQNQVVDITPAAQKILNHDISELIGKKAEDAFSDQHEFIKRLVKEGEYGCEVCLNKKKQEYCFDMQVTHLYDSHNTSNGRIIVLRDITERKQAEEALRKNEETYRAIFENTGTATIIVEGDTTISLANNGFQELSGYTRGEIEGVKSWTEFIADKDLEKMREFHKLRREEQSKSAPKNYEFQFVDKAGNVKDILLSVDFIPGTKKSVASLLNITGQKMVLNELRDAHELLYSINKDLERKVKNRTAKIERLIKQKDEFINQLGHDLKTPLTPMMALVPIIKGKIENPKDKELLEVLMRNVYYMKDLVTKTIDLAKLNSDKIEFSIEDTNLLSEVENIIRNNHILFEDNHIDVVNKIDENIIVKADKLRLNELLNNLITNSIKYAPEVGANIILDAKQREGFATISVEDTGIGMTEKQINHIFDEFYKADDSRHNLDSSGLGLPICKRIVKKHGGKIWAESQGKGKGSTFYFTLKMAEKSNPKNNV
jgi:PAS domain S-box-containing protein